MTYDEYKQKLDELPYGVLGFTIARSDPFYGRVYYHLYRGPYLGYIYELDSIEDAIEQLNHQYVEGKCSFIRPSWWTDEQEAMWNAMPHRVAA